MPFVMVSSAPSREMYQRVVTAMKLDDDRPSGMILHAASETSGGTVEIVDVWESEDAMQKFTSERLFPAFQETGAMEQVERAGPPTPREPFHFLH